MEHNTSNSVIAAFGGAFFGAYADIVKMLQAPAHYSYAIDWAETFQVCWKAAVGALVGLLVKFIWDKIFKTKKS
ncbi:MAG: hypothetical protein WCG90_08450 [Chitinophagia bacterium]